uniref:Uncharacterized protein n=1 Tax=Leersia perrieri TaxID=77586 RepID=A0A0D9VG17_9ORYZ
MAPQPSSPAGGLLRVLRTTRVAPAAPALPERALPLLFLEAMWLDAQPVERVFIYHLGPDVDANTNRYKLHYQPGHGVAFTVAELDGVEGVDELATDEPRELAKIAPLVPEIPKGGAVLALKATPPIIDRTLICDRKDMHDAFASPDNEVKELIRSPDAGKLVATFTLSRAHLQGVKDDVAAEAARRGVLPFRCTSTVATYGLTWLCFVRTVAESKAAEEDAHLVFSVDHRSRLEPRVPDKYFGNCVGPAFPTAPKKGLTAGTIADGVYTACAAVAAAVDEAVRGEDGYWET